MRAIPTTLENIPLLRQSYRAPTRAKGYTCTADEFIDMLLRQQGRCAICEKLDDQLKIDHCHKTGKVRGLVCERCNFMLGHAYDDPEVLQRGADYLRGNPRQRIGVARVYVRHVPACAHRSDRLYQDCDCPKWIWYSGAGRGRISARTRDWDTAEIVAREMIGLRTPASVRIDGAA